MFILLANYQIAEALDAPLKYLIRKPFIKSDHPPLLILMHGIGSNEKDLFSFAQELPPEFLIVSLQATIQLSDDSYAWYHVDFSSSTPIINTAEELNSRRLISDFIDWAITTYHCNASKVVLCGFSQGAIMSYSLAITHPEKIYSIALMSGRMLDEIKPLLVKTDMKKIKAFISHGKQDPVLSIEKAREAKTLLEKKHCDISYHEYNDVHTINASMLADLKSWLITNLH
jgi:phospholipase/carboxylesterase